MHTPRQKLVLAALSAGHRDSELSPVQAQKLFFLIDEKAAHLSGGPWFNFRPYDYGPFDSSVYSEFDALSLRGDVEILRSGRFRTYRLTEQGRQAATEYAKSFSQDATRYFGEVKDWVKSLSFSALVSTIYREYPEMRVNSIFQS